MKIRKIAAVSTALLTAAAIAVPAAAEEVGTVGINLADDDWLVQYWGGDPSESGNSGISSVNNAVITGDGSYTAEIVLEYEVPGITFAALCSDIESSSCPEDMSVTIDSVSVNGNSVEFGINGTPQWKEDGGKMRINIYNSWSSEAADTAVDKSSLDGAKTISVSFTVDGLEDDAPAETEAVAETEAPVTEAPVTEAPVTEAEIVLTEDVKDVEAAEEAAEKAPESDSAEESAPMGNTSASALLLVTALSAAAMAISRKKG